MFLPRILKALPPQFPQPQGNPPPGRMRVDHLVDKPLARRHKRVGKAVFVFPGALGDLGGVADVGAEDDLDRAFRPHHRDFGGRPGVIQIAAQVL